MIGPQPAGRRHRARSSLRQQLVSRVCLLLLAALVAAAVQTKSASASATKYCIRNMSGKIVWASARAGGRNCAAACRGFNGGRNRPLKAVAVGVSSAPSFLCRAQDDSFGGSKRSGFSLDDSGKATPCRSYAHGGPVPTPMTDFLSSRSFQCGCVADRQRYSYSGCPAPVWKTHTGIGGRLPEQTSCNAVCENAGRRAAVEDSPGQNYHVCRPRPKRGKVSSRVGWSAYQAGLAPGVACHFVSRDAVSGNSLSVYSFAFECLCI